MGQYTPYRRFFLLDGHEDFSKRMQCSPPSTRQKSRGQVYQEDSSKDSALRERSSCSPEVIMMNEHSSTFNPNTTAKIEELMVPFKQNNVCAIAIHEMQQATRVSDLTAFLFLEELIEYELTKDIRESIKQNHGKIRQREIWLG